jgi:hypothetical protein
MGDNITALANTGDGTDVLATDEIGGVHYPRSKVGFGTDGNYADVSSADPLPVTMALPSGAATDATLAAMSAKLESNEAGALIVGTAKEKFRDDFLTFVDGDKWDVIQAGTGQTITVAGSTGGSRYLNISSGTTANAETIIQAKIVSRAPVKLAFSLTSSQAIANSECHVELVEIDPVTMELVTENSVFSSPAFNDARNGFGLQFDGTSQNNARLKIRAQGVNEELAAGASLGTNSRTATGTTPNFFATVIIEYLLQTELALLSVRARDNTGVSSVSLVRTSYVPNPDRFYTIRIRVKNLSTAPASNTDWRIHFVRLLDASRMSVDFGMIGGSATGTLAAPVHVVASSTVATTLTSTTVNPVVPATPYFVNSAATTNGALILTGTSSVSSLYATNEGASPAYVKLYNKATAPTVGTDIPEMIIPVAAASGGVPGVANPNIGFHGFRFALGLGIAITRNAAHTDTTAIGASEVKVKLSRTV